MEGVRQNYEGSTLIAVMKLANSSYLGVAKVRNELDISSAAVDRAVDNVS